MYLKLLAILFLGSILLFSNCGPSRTDTEEEKMPELKFKSGDQICIMGKFDGVVTSSVQMGKKYELYYVDYVTPYGTKTGSYREFQLSAGKCPEQESTKLSEEVPVEKEESDSSW